MKNTDIEYFPLKTNNPDRISKIKKEPWKILAMISAIAIVCTIIGSLLFLKEQRINQVENIGAFINKVRHWTQIFPYEKISEFDFTSHIKKHYSSSSYFAYRSYSQPYERAFTLIEKYLLNNKYQILKYNNTQLPLCVVATGRNLASRHYYKQFLTSINNQQYRNYHIVFTDDSSQDNTSMFMRTHVKQKFPKLINKIEIIQNKQRVYSLANKNYMVMNKCAPQQIVIDIDADDALIGRQVFSLINTIYQQNPQFWITYTNYVFYRQQNREPFEGISKKIVKKQFDQKDVRKGGFSIMHLRCFRASLYRMIPSDYFIDPQTGTFWKWTSDLFIYSALLEMAGYEHYGFLPELTYFYHQDSSYSSTQQKKLYSLIGKTQTPFLPIKQIDSSIKVMKDPDFKLTDEEKQIIKHKIEQRYENIKKEGQSLQIFTQKQNLILKQLIDYLENQQTYISQIMALGNIFLKQSIRHKAIRASNLLINIFKNREYHEAEKNYYEAIYQMKDLSVSQLQSQQEFCILIDYKNNNKLNKLVQFLKSLYKQNFVDYQAVLNIQSQNQIEIVKQLIRLNFPEFMKKIIFTKQETIKNKIQNDCQPYQNIIMVDSNYRFVGISALTLLNSIFLKNQNVRWIFTDTIDYLHNTFEVIVRKFANVTPPLLAFKKNTEKMQDKDYEILDQMFGMKNGEQIQKIIEFRQQQFVYIEQFLLGQSIQ